VAMYDFATMVQYERDGPEVQEENMKKKGAKKRVDLHV